VQQGSHVLYCFAIDGKLVPQIATISRIRRDENTELFGYQRPEILSHVAAIKSYLESADPLVPNAVVIAFDESVSFIPAAELNDTYSQTGVLRIPTGVNGTPPPGWIVDGQQRLAAVRQARIVGFPICAVAFVATDEAQQRSQFILVNSVRPLPAGLITELLPGTGGLLPPNLRRRQLPARIAHRLNSDAESPFHGRIRTPTNPNGTIKDNSVLRMIENSLAEGALYRFRFSDAENNAEMMLGVLKNFWTAVHHIFGEAWLLPPRKSRLVHGVGIVSLGHLMDAITDRHRQVQVLSVQQYEAELAPLLDKCSWTAGFWRFGPGQERRWNELQNTGKDIQLLTNYLRVMHRALLDAGQIA
jgi:DGQHR domain-containing protein